MKHFNWHILAFILTGLVAGVVLFIMMPFGPGLSPDSIAYMQTAESLRSGQGYWVYEAPMTHFAPLYPTALAVMSGLQLRMITAGRVLQAGIFAMNVALFMYLVWIATRRNWIAGVVGGVLFLTSAEISFIIGRTTRPTASQPNSLLLP